MSFKSNTVATVSGSNTNIQSPLDANGNVLVDDPILNAKIKPLNQDANGNIGVNVENSITVSSNTSISSPLDASGNVKVAVENTPSVNIASALPAGTNTIGSVNIANTPNVNVANTPSVNVNVSPSAIAFTATTSSTANTATQLSTDTTFRDEITLYAPSSNTAPILIGPSGSVVFPIQPNSALTLRRTQLSLWYIQSSAASQTLYVIAGGS